MARDYNYFVYIIECADGLYYTGITNDLERRIHEHNEGLNPKSFTYRRRPVILKYIQQFSDVNQAIGWEKQLKGWNRKKKEALFNEDWEGVKKLAKRRSSQSSSASD